MEFEKFKYRVKLWYLHKQYKMQISIFGSYAGPGKFYKDGCDFHFFCHFTSYKKQYPRLFTISRVFYDIYNFEK